MYTGSAIGRVLALYERLQGLAGSVVALVGDVWYGLRFIPILRSRTSRDIHRSVANAQKCCLFAHQFSYSSFAR